VYNVKQKFEMKRAELIVLPADRTAQKKLGWSITENVGIGAVNPRGVTKLHISRPFHLLGSILEYDLYYDEIGRGYFLVRPETNFVTDPNGYKIPMVLRDVVKARQLADYVFRSDGEIIKDRDGNGSAIFSEIKDTIDVHQIMAS
jgi:hypothetical protein